MDENMNIKLSKLVDEVKKKKKRKNKLPIIKRRLYGWGFIPWVSNSSISQRVDGVEVSDSGADFGGGDSGGAMEENISSPYIYKIETDDEEFLDNKLDGVENFSKFATDKLKIKSPFSIKLTADRNNNNIKTLAHFNNADSNCCVYSRGRNLADILRSIAHELVHKSQFENDKIKGPVQDIGGPIEDEANAVAGQLVKEFGYDNPEIFE